MTESFSYQSFSSISRNRSAELAGSGNPQTSSIELVRQHEQRHESSAGPGASLEDLLKIRPAANPLVRAK